MLATTPILEGWGNANMPRNPDSSRFGKLYKIYFSQDTKQITGCSIELYMLEKSRLSSQQMNERNFHILYRMLADPIEADAKLLKKQKKKQELIIWDKSDLSKRVDCSQDGATGMIGFDQQLKDQCGLGRGVWKDWSYWNYLNGGSVMTDLHPLDRNAEGGYDRIYEDVPQGWQAADRVASCCEMQGREYEDQMHASATLWALEQFFDKETVLPPQLAALSCVLRQIQVIFEVTAGVLWLGQIEYTTDDDKCDVTVDEPKTALAIDQVCRLWKVDRALLIKSMNYKRVQVRAGVTQDVPAGRKEARTIRDSIARHVYDNIFLWLIGTCSDNLLSATGNFNEFKDMYIGVLDIFGFEFYEDEKLRPHGAECINGMDQFCINMCNEVLQNKFINVIFDSEQALYERQLHKRVELDLGKLRNEDTIGFLKGHTALPADLKDDNVPTMMSNIRKDRMTASGAKADAALKKTIQKVTKKYNGRVSFGPERGRKPWPDGPYGGWNEFDPRKGKVALVNKANEVCQEAGGGKGAGFDPHFRLDHYAANVTYDVRGWCDKDADKLTDFALDLLSGSSENRFVSPTYSSLKGGGPGLSVMTLFSNKLTRLIDTLDHCNCHFVRCIKASNPPAQGVFQPGLVVNQLAYTGMLSTLVIRRKGFPKRLPYIDFYDAFKLLPPNKDIGSGRGEAGDAEALVQWLNSGKITEVYDRLTAGMKEEVHAHIDWTDLVLPQVREGVAPISQREDAIHAGTPNDPDEQPLIFMRDWLFRELEKEALAIKRDSANLIVTIVGSKTNKDKYQAQNRNTAVLRPMMRSLIERSNYLSSKFNYLDTTGRMDLHRVLRGHLSRAQYMTKRSAFYEQENRHRVQEFIFATCMRQRYYEEKLKSMERENMDKEERRMRQQEHLAKEYMADRIAEIESERDERKTMCLEDNYAVDIRAAKLAEKYGQEKEACLLKASRARQAAADALDRVKQQQTSALMRDLMMAKHAEAIEAELKKKCLGVFKKMNLVISKPMSSKKLMKLPPDEDAKVYDL